MEEFLQLLPILIPIFILEVGVRIFCVVDVLKEHRKVNLLSKTAWIIVILLINFAWVVYLIAGRSDDITVGE